MASAAAVATTVDQSPQPYQELDEITNTTATVIGADEKLPDEVDGDVDDDEDVARPMRRQPVISNLNNVQDDLEDDVSLENDDNDDGGEGLFGSEPEEEDGSPKPRQLDDEELDSGDDEDRNDRAQRNGDQPAEEEELMDEVFLDARLARQPEPEPSDGELYLLKVPRFLSIEPHAFNADTFRPPTKDHHSKEVPTSTFSARNTAFTTIRWRPSPSSPTQLQSNSRIIRWSDGSLTLQIANEPQTQYNIRGRPLATPQANPPKPTPNSIKSATKNRKPVGYRIEDESFTYLTAPNQSSALLRTIHKFTTSLTVDPPSDANHAVIERLRAQYAAVQSGGGGDLESTGMGVVHITEDPELSKKKAELAEKEKQRAQKRREAQEQRERERGVGPRSGFARRGERSGGLTIGGLEDDDELGRGAIGRGAAAGKSRPKQKKQNRRGEIWSDEEEEYGRRIRTKEDEYDEEDDFVARSDEEEEEVEESEGDEDEGIVLAAKPSGKRPQEGGNAREGGTTNSKRDLDIDAEGDIDEEALGTAAIPAEQGGAGSPTGRATKRRRVIEEDEDEE